MARFRPPPPPRPDLLRQPSGSFGWLEDRLLHDGWIGRLGVDGLAVLVLLALAADRRGASFYSRARMAERLGLSHERIDDGLRRLLALELVALRPWSAGARDGVWQLLPVPTTPRRASAPTRDSAAGPSTIGAVLADLGLRPGSDGRPDSRAS